jgi:hypothetical protein
MPADAAGTGLTLASEAFLKDYQPQNSSVSFCTIRVLAGNLDRAQGPDYSIIGGVAGFRGYWGCGKSPVAGKNEGTQSTPKKYQPPGAIRES